MLPTGMASTLIATVPGWGASVRILGSKPLKITRDG